jgi:two-component system sensor histidine kinase VicK
MSEMISLRAKKLAELSCNDCVLPPPFLTIAIQNISNNRRYLCMNKADTLTINYTYHTKFQKVSNIQINGSAPVRQENSQAEIGKKLDVIEEIKDSKTIRRLCLNSISSANEEILVFYPTVNSFLRHKKIGAIEALTDVVRKRNVRVKMLVPPHPLIQKFVEQKPFLLDTTFNMKTNKENNDEFEPIRFLQEISETRVTILVIDKNISFVTELESDIEEPFEGEGAVGFTTYSTDFSRIFPYISFFENLWTQVGLYQQVTQVNEKLIIQDKKYKEFISIAVHELRAPLQPIIGLSYLLRNEKEALTGKEDESLDTILRNAERLGKLAENILDLIKIENDNLNLKKETFDLDKLIRDVVFDFEKQLAHRHRYNPSHNQKYPTSNIELRYCDQQFSTSHDKKDDMEKDASQLGHGSENNVKIEADKVRIYQVLSNLINNAIKSIDDLGDIVEERIGEVIVSMRCAKIYQHQVEYNNGHDDNKYGDPQDANDRSVPPDVVAIVSITDTGRGIDLDIFPRLFTKFTTNFKTGTGLGLFISKSIIEAHRGKIWMYNNKGRKGATIQFSLPLKIQ